MARDIMQLEPKTMKMRREALQNSVKRSNTLWCTQGVPEEFDKFKYKNVPSWRYTPLRMYKGWKIWFPISIRTSSPPTSTKLLSTKLRSSLLWFPSFFCFYLTAVLYRPITISLGTAVGAVWWFSGRERFELWSRWKELYEQEIVGARDTRGTHDRVSHVHIILYIIASHVVCQYTVDADRPEVISTIVFDTRTETNHPKYTYYYTRYGTNSGLVHHIIRTDVTFARCDDVPALHVYKYMQYLKEKKMEKMFIEIILVGVKKMWKIG